LPIRGALLPERAARTLGEDRRGVEFLAREMNAGNLDRDRNDPKPPRHRMGRSATREGKLMTRRYSAAVRAERARHFAAVEAVAEKPSTALG
jgi:hypothetical protein